MLAVILEFEVIAGHESQFIAAWTECTQVIYQHFGSLGSRLHQAGGSKFIAYAQWPDADIYAQQEWPLELTPVRDRMRATLVTGKPKVLHQLQLEVDLLKSAPYTTSNYL